MYTYVSEDSTIKCKFCKKPLYLVHFSLKYEEDSGYRWTDISKKFLTNGSWVEPNAMGVISEGILCEPSPGHVSNLHRPCREGIEQSLDKILSGG